MSAFNRVRAKVWQQQPDEFFDCAIIEGDGAQVDTSAEKKEAILVSASQTGACKRGHRGQERLPQQETCQRADRRVRLPTRKMRSNVSCRGAAQGGSPDARTDATFRRGEAGLLLLHHQHDEVIQVDTASRC